MAERRPQDEKKQRSASDQPTFAQLLLEMPQDDGEFERLPREPRDITFD